MKKELNYQEGYKHSIKNAKELIELAKMASTICYGKANSLLILAVEECVKASMLISKRVDPSQNNNDFVKYFSHHKFKHETLKELESSLGLIKKMIDISITPAFKAKNKKGAKLTVEEAMNAVDQGYDDLLEFFEKLEKETGKADEVWNKFGIETNKNWWEEADHYKQRGFYVGFNKGSLKWETPNSISKKQYEKSYKIVTSFYKMTSDAENVIEDPDFIEMWDEIKKGRDKE